MSNNIIGKNTPRIDLSSSSLLPYSYEIQKFHISTIGDSSEKDLRPLLDSFVITEDLNSPFLVLSVLIRDDQNFFARNAFKGEEQIRVKINIKNNSQIGSGGTGTAADDNATIELTFYVKEYPSYNKTLDILHTQTYTIIAISKFAYLGSLKQISKSIKGNTLDNIKKIFIDDLNNNNVRVLGNAADTAFEGIITTRPPLDAIEWLRKRTFYSNSPFYIFGRVNEKEGGPIITSLEYLQTQGAFKKYQYWQHLTSQGQSSSQELSRSRLRIFDMKSNLKFDKLSQAIAGAFSRQINRIDYGSGSYAENKTNSKEAGVNEIFTKTTTNVTQLNVLSSSQNSISAVLDGNINKAMTYLSQAETLSHEIIVYGHPSINVGKTIEVVIPKSVTGSTTSSKDYKDEYMSGKYIISMSSHIFKDGIYKCKCKLMRKEIKN